jgi:hypothetical protein
MTSERGAVSVEAPSSLQLGSFWRRTRRRRRQGSQPRRPSKRGPEHSVLELETPSRAHDAESERIAPPSDDEIGRDHVRPYPALCENKPGLSCEQQVELAVAREPSCGHPSGGLNSRTSPGCSDAPRRRRRTDSCSAGRQKRTRKSSVSCRSCRRLQARLRQPLWRRTSSHCGGSWKRASDAPPTVPSSGGESRSSSSTVPWSQALAPASTTSTTRCPRSWRTATPS